jgi:hypothetical protein
MVMVAVITNVAAFLNSMPNDSADPESGEDSTNCVMGIAAAQPNLWVGKGECHTASNS